MSKIPILALSLPPTHPSLAALPPPPGGPLSAEELTKKLMALKEVLDASRFESELMLVTPETGVEGLEEKLKEKQWKGVIIGFGIRANPALSPFFESLINLIHSTVGPEVKFVFTTSVEGTVGSLERGFPV